MPSSFSKIFFYSYLSPKADYSKKIKYFTFSWSAISVRFLSLLNLNLPAKQQNKSSKTLNETSAATNTINLVS